MCENLEYGVEGQDRENFYYLFYGYTHPATAESFIQICYAILGKESLIDIRVPQPAVLLADIEVKNKNFIKLLETVDHQKLIETKDENYLIRTTIFDELDWHGDIATFMAQFIPFSYKLGINID